jgi:hypothetical protein
METIDEATKLFDIKVGHLYKDSLTLEMDAEVVNNEISNEDNKDNDPN